MRGVSVRLMQASKVSDNAPYFFLSYARTPKLDPSAKNDPDHWVHKLYQDLCEAILGMTSVRPESVGFMDRENRPGAIWPKELSRALATCRVFVPLFSERYFNSENCGKEWFAFARREMNHRARGHEPADAIVPALWAAVRSDSMPEVAKSVRYGRPDLSPRYGAEGFYGLMKLKRYQEDYEMAVYQLARRIVQVANETKISSELPTEYHSLQSAFGRGGGLGAETGQLQITVLSLDTSTLPVGRTGDYYGSTPRMWSPYRPDYQQPLAEYAADLTEYLGFRPAVGTFDEHTADWAAHRQLIPPSLCLVDPWAVVSPAYQKRLRRLDQLEQPWVSVLVPWNSQDAEMAVAEQGLRHGLSLSLRRQLESVPHRCRMAATGIPTLQDFSELLPEMAMIMQKRFRKEAPAYPPKGPSIARPRLRAADPEDSGAVF
jgi:FxsC-like protein